jgi:hypothetical protein
VLCFFALHIVNPFVGDGEGVGRIPNYPERTLETYHFHFLAKDIQWALTTKKGIMKKKTVYAPQQSLFDDLPESSNEPTAPEGDRDVVFDLVDSLSAPIIVFDQSWADTLPDRFVDLVPAARLAAGLLDEQFATEVECILYIYTWSMVSPIDDYQWANIYTHLSCKVLEEMLGEDRWESIKAPRELSSEEQRKLLDLRRRIYVIRRTVLKQRLKETDEEAPHTDLPPNPGKPEKKGKSTSQPSVGQQSLF